MSDNNRARPVGNGVRKYFARMYGEEVAADLLRSTAVACIGPVTAEAAEQYGIRTAIMPEQYTIPALVDATVAYFSKAQAPK